jgi:hypothetical protein
MSKGSALASMLWVAIIVYATDRKWDRCGAYCIIAGLFAGMGLVHQNKAFSNFMDGFQGVDNTSPFQFMMGYFSMAGVCVIMWLLQKFQGKNTEEGKPGHEDDHGYLPPLEEAREDNLFLVWWEPVTGSPADLPVDESKKTSKTDELDRPEDMEVVEEYAA